MFKSILSSYEIGYFLNQKGSIDMLDTWVDDNLFGEKKILVSEQIEKSVSYAAGVASSFTLGLNWKVFTSNGIQGLSQLYLRAITSSMKHDKTFPSLSHFNKAVALTLQAVADKNLARKLDLITATYLPEDISTLKGKKYKILDSGVINRETMFAMDRMIEQGLKTIYITSQMIKDGTFDAHRVEEFVDDNGNKRVKLVYDETLDERFKGNKELKDAIKKSMHKEGYGLDKNGNMLIAYDWNLRNKYSMYSRLMIPTNEKSLKPHYSHLGIASAIGMYRSFVTDFYTNAVARQYESITYGDYVKTDDGYVWTANTYKGVFRSLMDLPSNIMNLAKEKSWKAIPEVDKQNYIMSALSLLAYSALAAIGRSLLGAAGGDDKKRRYRNPAEYFLARAMDDLILQLTLGPMWGAIDEPFLFLAYYKRVFNSTVNAITDAQQGDLDKSWEDIKKITPVVKDFNF
jgi:hypothetical protein